MMSKDAMPSLDASLPRVLADLEGLGIEGLRRQWRNHLGGEAPTHLPRWLFLSVLADRQGHNRDELERPSLLWILCLR